MQNGKILDNRYRIIEKLGEGGMGAVYKAYDKEWEKEIAIKTLLPQTFSDKKSTDQFKREFKLSQQLRHDNITAAYDFKRSTETPYIVMEYVRGEKLTDYIYSQPQKRLDEKSFLELANQILDGVEYAHKKGVIHRDLKSGNIMITDEGEVKIMDFGIAVSLRETYSKSTGSPITITIYFASPEQINGEPPSVSMDIYSLGCVFYEMLNGDPPFTQGDILHQQLTKQPEPIQDVSEHLNSVILKCLEKKKEDRFQSVEEIQTALAGRDAEITVKIPKARKKRTGPAEKRIVPARSLFLILLAVLLVMSVGLFVVLTDIGGRSGASEKVQLEAARQGQVLADESAWGVASRAENIEAYRKYLSDFPTGRHASEARGRINAVQEEEQRRQQEAEWRRAEAQDDDAFRRAKQENTQSAYRAYLNSYPSGRHVSEARERIEVLTEPRQGQIWRESVTGMEFVWIPAGEFLMGSNSGDDDERSVHRVAIDGFWMGKHEVTQRQWEKVKGFNPSASYARGDNYPVQCVSWIDVQDFINRLNSQTGKNFRLPTEAEWEYACRAGTTSDRYGFLSNIAWWYNNSHEKAHPVGQKDPNDWGLYDMLGNVWEWCSDWYGDYTSGFVRNPQGPSSGSERVIRGGSSFSVYADYVRSANRAKFRPSGRNYNGGFRLARNR